MILTSLSIIWDFQVFTQPFLLRQQRPDPDYWLMSIYAYEKSFGISQYGLGSAIARRDARDHARASRSSTSAR